MKTFLGIITGIAVTLLLIVLLILGVYLFVASVGVALAFISGVAAFILPAMILGALVGLFLLMIVS